RDHLHLRHPERAHRHQHAVARSCRGRHRLQGLEHAPGYAGADFRRTGQGGRMNLHGIRAIYKFEMARTGRTLMQSVLSPVVSTSLYFVVFGSAIGSQIKSVEHVPYGAFIIPGLVMLSLLMQSVSNASFGNYFPKFVGTIYEVHSAPRS